MVVDLRAAPGDTRIDPGGLGTAGLICSKKVAMSDIPKISSGCMPKLLVEEIIEVVMATTDAIVNVPTIDFV